MHRQGTVVILLTAGLGVSILASVGVAGTYVYRDADGKEVRELPRKERRSRETEAGRTGVKPAVCRRGAGETPASVIIEKVESQSSQEKR